MPAPPMDPLLTTVNIFLYISAVPFSFHSQLSGNNFEIPILLFFLIASQRCALKVVVIIKTMLFFKNKDHVLKILAS